MTEPAIVASEDLIRRAAHLEELAVDRDHLHKRYPTKSYNIAARVYRETAQVLRQVAAEPHRRLLFPELQKVHERLSPLDRAIFVAIMLGDGEIVTYATIGDAAWGNMPPASIERSIHVSVSRTRKLMPAGWRFVCENGQGYRLVRNG